MCVSALLAFPVWASSGCGDDETGPGNGATAGGGGSDGTGGTGGTGGGTTAPLTLEQQVVGAWAASGTCQGSEVTIGEFICPGGRVRGAQSFDNFDFLVCGTWTAEDPDQVESRVQLISVQDPSDPGNQDVLAQPFTYDAESDQLTLNIACNIPLQRLEGGVTEEDCESSVPGCNNDGGSGPIGCTEDCQCGRCWYCESGTCRYGGEGEFGCVRGCGEFIP